jgi:hypothetical protein
MVEAASNSREGGQDREWAWSHRRLFGHTFARPVACRSQRKVHRADGSVHGHEVEPLWGSDPMNTALRTIANRRSDRTTSSLPLCARLTALDRAICAGGTRATGPTSKRYEEDRICGWSRSCLSGVQLVGPPFGSETDPAQHGASRKYDHTLADMPGLRRLDAERRRLSGYGPATGSGSGGHSRKRC